MEPRALRGLSGRKTEEAAKGLVKIVVGAWGLSFLTAHPIFGVPLSKEHCLLWSQAHGTVRATPPISLTSTMRERKGSLQSGVGRYSVGRRGWCWRGSAMCQTLKLFCRNSSVQRKETRRPSNGSGGPIHLWPDASPASRGSGWHARVLDSEALHYVQATQSPAPGCTEKIRNTSQAVSYPSLSVLNRVLTLGRTSTIGAPQRWPSASDHPRHWAFLTLMGQFT